MDNSNYRIENRQHAESLVNKYATAGAVVAFVVTIIPGAATLLLCALEAAMLKHLSSIYRSRWEQGEEKAASAAVAFAALFGQLLAVEASIILGPLAFFAKPAIAAGIIKGLGRFVISHFEGLPPSGPSEGVLEQ